MESRKRFPKTPSYLFIFATVAQLCIFKYFYPHLDFTFNSHNYIQDAILKADFSLWPIGYSKFLGFIHTVSQTDTIVVVFQYVALQASAFVLFVVLNHFYHLAAHIKNVLFLILIFNPLSLYLSNYVLPDALFAAISLLWTANMIIIVHKPSVANAATQAALVAVLFTLKIQALFYPAVSVIVFLFINRPLWFRALAITLTLITILSTIEIIRQTAQKETGHQQLSAILSWQIANNALYGFDHIDTTNLHIPADAKTLHKRITGFFNNNASISPFYGSAYLYAYESPLRQYWLGYVLEDKNRTEAQGWYKLAPTVGAWGRAITQASPSTYVRYYLLPNTVNYLFPMTDEVARYNSGEKNVSLATKEWFSYNDSSVSCQFPNLQRRVFLLFSATFMVTNLIMLVGLVFAFAKKIQIDDIHNKKQFLIFLTSFYCLQAISCIALQPVDILSVAFSIFLYPSLGLIILSLFSTQELTYSESQTVQQ